MEKRFVLFFVLSIATFAGYALIKSLVLPPAPVALQQEDGNANQPPEEPNVDTDEPSATSENSDATAAKPSVSAAVPDSESVPDETASEPKTPVKPENAVDLAVLWPDRWFSLGAYRPGSGTTSAQEPESQSAATSPPFLVTFKARGGSIERIELTERNSKGKLRYRELLERSGYLGHLALTPEPSGGCRVNVVGQGTPAALATAASASSVPGLQVGDVIYEINGTSIDSPRDAKEFLKTTKPGDQIRLNVRRASEGGAAKDLQLNATLDVHPLQLIEPERPINAEASVPLHPASFLLSLLQIDNDKSAKGARELKLDESLRNDTWRLEPTADGRGVEFHLQVASTGTDGETVELEVIKRFHLGDPLADSTTGTPYHLNYEIEIKNLSTQPHRIAYRQDGPNGLPREGFWYSNKLHPDLFKVAGARDVVWRFETRQGAEVLKTFDQFLLSCSQIYAAATKAEKKDKSQESILFDTNIDADGVPMPLYVAVDTQYFVVALKPVSEKQVVYEQAAAYVVGKLSNIPKAAKKATNVSFHLDSEAFTLPAFDPNQENSDAIFKQNFEIYAGPKVAEELAPYGLQECIYYGWFAPVSRLLAVVLHFFFALVKNYGVAIIMLTVLVRSGMFPLSRKAAKNAAMMQALAPQMKKITEKYKEDMEKRAKAQQELFKKHNYNPFGGCWMMFLQLPIFIGLYRCLSVDINLRQAALIPGVKWCSNLAGPDMLFEWPQALSWTMFTELGMLGPYFNILPMFTVALFLVQQKLFTPPPTDDQSRMQLTMMKYMTVFIGVMFFKVAAGLCLYFIASSLWGIAERKLLPKPKLAADGGSDPEPLPAKPKPKRPRPKLPDGGKSGRQQPSKKKRR